MTDFVASGYLSNSTRTEAEMKQAFEDNLGATKQLPGGIASSSLTIASGSVTPTRGAHFVDTEAAGATDDLTNVVQTNLPDGSVLLLRTVTSSRVVVVKNNAGGAGQVSLANNADFSMNDASMLLVLLRQGALWTEVGRFYGNAASAHRTFYGTPGLAGANRYTGMQQEAQGANIASAATLALGTDGNYFHVTGVTGITAISSAPTGTEITLVFDGILTITHNAVTLILPFGANIVTFAGLTLKFRSEGVGIWRMVSSASAESPLIMDRVTADTTVSNTAAETTVYTFSVPGGTLQSNRRLRLQIQASLADNGGAAQSITLRLKYGATTIATLSVVTGTDNGAGNIATIGATAFGAVLTGLVSGDGGTGAQIGTLGWQSPAKILAVVVGNPGTDDVVGLAKTGGRGTAAEDSTAAKNLVLTAQWNAAAPQRIFVLEHAVLVRE